MLVLADNASPPGLFVVTGDDLATFGSLDPADTFVLPGAVPSPCPLISLGDYAAALGTIGGFGPNLGAVAVGIGIIGLAGKSAAVGPVGITAPVIGTGARIITGPASGPSVGPVITGTPVI